MFNTTLLLGIGNVLWADEGFGPAVIARMQERVDITLPSSVELLDGGTQGLYLLPLVQDAARIIVFDAVDFGRPAGEMVTLRDKEIPAFFGQRPLSLHQTGFTDVLAAAELTGYMPESITLIGIQYANIATWGGGLSSQVVNAIDLAIEMALQELQIWEKNQYVPNSPPV